MIFKVLYVFLAFTFISEQLSVLVNATDSYPINEDAEREVKAMEYSIAINVISRLTPLKEAILTAHRAHPEILQDDLKDSFNAAVMTYLETDRDSTGYLQHKCQSLSRNAFIWLWDALWLFYSKLESNQGRLIKSYLSLNYEIKTQEDFVQEFRKNARNSLNYPYILPVLANYNFDAKMDNNLPPLISVEASTRIAYKYVLLQPLLELPAPQTSAYYKLKAIYVRADYGAHVNRTTPFFPNLPWNTIQAAHDDAGVSLPQEINMDELDLLASKENILQAFRILMHPAVLRAMSEWLPGYVPRTSHYLRHLSPIIMPILQAGDMSHLSLITSDSSMQQDDPLSRLAKDSNCCLKSFRYIFADVFGEVLRVAQVNVPSRQTVFANKLVDEFYATAYTSHQRYNPAVEGKENLATLMLRGFEVTEIKNGQRRILFFAFRQPPPFTGGSAESKAVDEIYGRDISGSLTSPNHYQKVGEVWVGGLEHYLIAIYADYNWLNQEVLGVGIGSDDMKRFYQEHPLPPLFPATEAETNQDQPPTSETSRATGTRRLSSNRLRHSSQTQREHASSPDYMSYLMILGGGLLLIAVPIGAAIYFLKRKKNAGSKDTESADQLQEGVLNDGAQAS